MYPSYSWTLASERGMGRLCSFPNTSLKAFAQIFSNFHWNEMRLFFLIEAPLFSALPRIGVESATSALMPPMVGALVLLKLLALVQVNLVFL